MRDSFGANSVNVRGSDGAGLDVLDRESWPGAGKSSRVGSEQAHTGVGDNIGEETDCASNTLRLGCELLITVEDIPAVFGGLDLFDVLCRFKNSAFVNISDRTHGVSRTDLLSYEEAKLSFVTAHNLIEDVKGLLGISLSNA